MSSVADLDRFVTFDTETTGTDRNDDRIVTAYAGLVRRDGTIIGSKSWVVNPGVPIPDESTEIHGITNEYAAEHGATPAEAIREMADLIGGRIGRGTPIVAYNASYDLTLLDRECRRHLGVSLMETVACEPVVIDPFVIDKGIDKYRKGKRTLGVTAQVYGVELGDDAHDAEADAVATAKVAFAVLDRVLERRPDITVTELMQMQTTWAMQQAESLQAYFDRIGKDATVDGRWPWAPFEQAEEPTAA